MKSPWWRRRWVVISGCAGALLLLVFVIGPWAATPIVRAKLQAMVAEQLNAELRIGRLAYVFPYGVNIYDARLTARDTDGTPVDLLATSFAQIKLARLPLRAGPLVIQNVTIDSPAVHLIQTRNGMIGRGLTKKDQPPEQRKQKLSEMFELRHVDLSDGQVVYEDRTIPNTVPLVWR